MSDWVTANATWIFSGVGIAVPIALVTWWLSRSQPSQRQRGGSQSTNLQAGGDIRIQPGRPDSDD